MKLKAGYGFWALGYYPLGGEFHRAGDHGLEIKQITRHYEKYYHGANVECETKDGKRIACDSNHLID